MTVVSAETLQGETMHVGDFVCLERIGADREWRNVLGKVIEFPTSFHVRVEVFTNGEHAPNAVKCVDNKLREIALQDGNESLWQEREDLGQELQEVAVEEDRASARLFKVREMTLMRQSRFSAQTREMMVELDKTRQAMDRVPLHLWRDVRAPGRALDDLSVFQGVMVAMKEDRAVGWEAIQVIIRQSDFMDRLMQLDCTVTPLVKARRKKILDLLYIRTRDVLNNLKKLQDEKYTGTQLSITLRSWLLAQIACSEAREAEERVVDECFAEHQEQATLVREVNIHREKMAALREKIAAHEKLILGGASLTNLLRDKADDAEDDSADTLFFKCIVNDRPVKEIFTRESVLAVFGPKTEEVDADNSVFVRLTPEEVERLQNTVRAVQDVHDLKELEALAAAEEREELEMRELQQRMEELRGKDVFTEEDEEEMRQLDVLLTGTVHRHETTLWRTAQLQSMGRDKLFLEKRRCLSDVVHSDLRLAFSGDRWSELLSDEEHCQNLRKALANDLSSALGLPCSNFSSILFKLGSLLVTLSVRHSRDVTGEELQALANEADFQEFCAYYEMIFSSKTYPINTDEQRARMENAMYEELLAKNFTGAGLSQYKEDFDYDDDDGETDDEDYRKPQVYLTEVRNECGAEVRFGYPLLAHVAATHDALLAEVASQ